MFESENPAMRRGRGSFVFYRSMKLRNYRGDQGRNPAPGIGAAMPWEGVRLLAIGLLALAVSSCGSTGSYSGYKNRSYTVRGVRYYPLSVEQALRYSEVGEASWYDESGFLGIGRGSTAIGEPYRNGARAGAHKTLPLPCRVLVTNLDNGRQVRLRLNDRGPFVGNRILDVTKGVAGDLDFKERGLTPVRIEVLSVGDGKYEVRAPRRRSGFFGR